MNIVFVYFALKFKIIEFVLLKMFKVLQARPFFDIFILFIRLKLKQKQKHTNGPFSVPEIWRQDIKNSNGKHYQNGLWKVSPNIQYLLELFVISSNNQIMYSFYLFCLLKIELKSGSHLPRQFFLFDSMIAL